MSSNPYQSPSLPEPSAGGTFPPGAPAAAQYRYLPSKNLARWVTYIFVGNGLFELAFSVVMLFVGPTLDVEPEFATHAIGKMPLMVELLDAEGRLVDRLVRNSDGLFEEK